MITAVLAIQPNGTTAGRASHATFSCSLKFSGLCGRSSGAFSTWDCGGSRLAWTTTSRCVTIIWPTFLLKKEATEKHCNPLESAIYFVEQLCWPPVPSYAKGLFFGRQVTVSETFSAKKSESFVPWLLLVPLEVPVWKRRRLELALPLGGVPYTQHYLAGPQPKMGCLNDVFYFPFWKAFWWLSGSIWKVSIVFFFRGVLANCHSSKEQWMFCLRIYFMNLFPPPKN